jgi:hypothetical protein
MGRRCTSCAPHFSGAVGHGLCLRGQYVYICSHVCACACSVCLCEREMRVSESECRASDTLSLILLCVRARCLWGVGALALAQARPWQGRTHTRQHSMLHPSFNVRKRGLAWPCPWFMVGRSIGFGVSSLHSRLSAALRAGALPAAAPVRVIASPHERSPTRATHEFTTRDG